MHSDLKPANFVLVNDEVKLIDFNISNVTGDRTSVTVQNECGTIEYMSPDMFIKDETTDGRVKIYFLNFTIDDTRIFFGLKKYHLNFLKN